MLLVIVNTVQKLLRLLPILFLAGATVYIVVNPEKNLLNVIKANGKKIRHAGLMLILLTVGFFAVNAGLNFFQSKQKSSVVLGLNYVEASSGLNPNGTKFTVNELLCDEILEGVSKEGNWDIGIEELRNSFSVTPMRVAESVSLEQPYIATEYYVEFRKNSDTQFLDPNAVMETYVKAVRGYFSEHYSRKTNILNVDFSGLSDADYMDIDQILDANATKLWEYMNVCSKENATFRSQQTGETFKTLAQKIWNYKEVAIENYRAFVLKNGLSKDKGQYTGKLNYENRLLNMDYLKNTALYQINLDVINRYERDMARIVLVPTRDENGEFYMSRTKLGVDDFSNAAETASDNAASLLKDISNNNYKITQMHSVSGQSAAAEEADQMIATLKTDLEEMAETALVTVSEYDQQDGEGYITVTEDDATVVLRSSVFNAGKRSVFFLAALLLLILFRPAGGDRRKRGVI